MTFGLIQILVVLVTFIHSHLADALWSTFTFLYLEVGVYVWYYEDQFSVDLLC